MINEDYQIVSYKRKILERFVVKIEKWIFLISYAIVVYYRRLNVSF